MLKSKNKIVVTNTKSKKKIVITPKRLRSKPVNSLSGLSADIRDFYNRLSTDSQFALDWERACDRQDRRSMQNLFGQSTFNNYNGSIRFTSEMLTSPDGRRFRYHCCYCYFWWNHHRYSLDFCHRRTRNNH